MTLWLWLYDSMTMTIDLTLRYLILQTIDHTCSQYNNFYRKEAQKKTWCDWWNLDKLKLAIHVAISDADFDPLKCQNELCNHQNNFVKIIIIIGHLLLVDGWSTIIIMCRGRADSSVASFVLDHPAHFISLSHFSTSATPFPRKQPPRFLNLEGPF